MITLRKPSEWPANITLTVKCDLNCTACNKAGFYKKPWLPDVTEKTFVKILDLIEKAGFQKFLRILGGEPTLHPKCLDFMRIAKKRGFGQWIYSNNYSPKAKRVLDTIHKEGLATIQGASFKTAGSATDLMSQSTFCSPTDLGIAPDNGCWQLERCGYDADELGFTPCPGGAMASYFLCPEVRTWDLTRFLDPEWITWALQKLCLHCGAVLYQRIDLAKTPGIEKVGSHNTYMTETWKRILEG